MLTSKLDTLAMCGNLPIPYIDGVCWTAEPRKETLKEMLKLYLGDPLVALHQRAARCMSAYTPASKRRQE